jgi:integrase
MGRRRHDELPKHLYLHSLNHSYYYKNPGMPRKANFGKDRTTAVQLAKVLNTKYRTQLEQRSIRLEAAIDVGSPPFEAAFEEFVEKYIRDYRLKQSTAALLQQRRKRLSKQIGNVQVATIDTQMLREAISDNSQFEQGKMRTLLLRFFRYAKSNGTYPSHLVNPVDDLFVDPVPHKKRHRMTIEQFRAMHKAAPQWLQWLMTLGFHLALRRVDLVNLRFTDIVGGRIVSPIRKTDTDARELEATSVDFPIHPDVQHVINESRRSSLRVGRCPFIVHRSPERRTKRATDALSYGRMEHPAQILPDYATKAFNSVRQIVCKTTNVFAGLSGRQLPTLHEIRALSSHLYAKAGYSVSNVQDLMAHTDPDMTREYQKGHARKVLRVDMMLPFSVSDDDCGVREEPPIYVTVNRLAA